MKITLPTSIILAAIILVIGFFIFNYYENIQIRKSCETIATNMTISDVPDNVLNNLKNEVENEYPWAKWQRANPGISTSVYYEEYNKILNKKVLNYLKSQEERNIEECVVENF